MLKITALRDLAMLSGTEDQQRFLQERNPPDTKRTSGDLEGGALA